MVAVILHAIVAINSIKTSLFRDVKSTMVAEILRPADLQTRIANLVSAET